MSLKQSCLLLAQPIPHSLTINVVVVVIVIVSVIVIVGAVAVVVAAVVVFVTRMFSLNFSHSMESHPERHYFLPFTLFLSPCRLLQHIGLFIYSSPMVSFFHPFHRCSF